MRFAILMLLAASLAHAQIELPAEKILKAFGESCSMNGKLAATTTEQAKVLVDMLVENRDNPDCSTLPWAAASANLLVNNSQNFENLAITTTESEYLMAMREERILLTALAAAKTDPNAPADLIATIESQLQYVQRGLTRAAQTLTANRKNQIFSARNRTYNSLVQTGQNVFSPGAMSDGCWTKRKSWFEGITVAATSMLASTLSSTYALPISAAAELAGQLMDVIRRARINNTISKVSDSIANKAYQCGVEKIAEQWCEARDQKSALNALAKDLTKPRDKTPVLRGLEILDEELPVVLAWLEKVAIGMQPSTGEHSDKYSRYLNRKTLVERASIEGNGMIHDRKAIFDRAPSQEQKWLEIRRLIEDLRSNLVTLATPLRHPVYELTNETVYPYFLLGRDSSNYPKGKDGKIIAWNDFNALSSDDWGTDYPAYVPDIEAVGRRFTESIRMADEVIKREREQVIHAEALLLLSDAVEQDFKGYSPMKSLTTAKEYLVQNAPKEFPTAVEEKLFWDTENKLEQVIYKIGNALNRDGSGDPATALKDIYEIARLDFGSILFEAEVRKTLRLALNDLPIRLSSLDSAHEAYLLANDDLIATFELLKENGSLDDARDDANSAQSSTYTNLKEFGAIFDDGIKTTLENYKKKEKVEGENSPSRELRAALCYKLYSLPEWPKKIKPELCEGTKLVSSVDGGPKTDPWSKEILKKNLEDRICLYYDFKRQRKIYQDTCKRGGEHCKKGG